MLKRIGVHQLTVGMHIKEFCGSWMEHPFWRTSFVITDPKDIDTILASSIKEVWIDCTKGLDVPMGEPAISESESEAQVEAELTRALSETREVKRSSTTAELARAVKICAKSKQAVASMFNEARMGKIVDTVGAQRLVEEIAGSVTRNPGALISLARLKTADDYTYMHSVAVCALMIALSKQLNLDEAQTRSAGIAGLLHDLGKAAMPMAVLNKPGKLTDEEFAIIKSHPAEGYQMLLAGHNVDPVTLDVVLHHHEKTDGSGYPENLKDMEISQFAKMGAVCDVYDAITSNRPYKAGWDPAESLRRMAEWSAGHFDEKVFHAFVKSVGIYPIGSLVRLESGLLGIVASQGPDSLLKPAVRTFYSVADRRHIEPRLTELFRPGNADRIVSVENAANWGLGDLNHLWTGGEPRAMAT